MAAELSLASRRDRRLTRVELHHRGEPDALVRRALDLDLGATALPRVWDDDDGEVIETWVISSAFARLWTLLLGLASFVTNFFASGPAMSAHVSSRSPCIVPGNASTTRSWARRSAYHGPPLLSGRVVTPSR